MAAKRIARIITSRQFREGGGFKVLRPIGDESLRELDPFLLLDHMGPTDYKPGEAVGAPDHPHRGFQTVTYCLEGAFQHLDSSGLSGKLPKGAVQWMTAGKGVIHAEMPSEDIMVNGGRVEGFQIWVNLPKRLKMTNPRYQDYMPEKIPKVKLPDGKSTVSVLVGTFQEATSPIEVNLPTTILDICLEKNGSTSLTVLHGLNAVVYCYRGSGTCETEALQAGQMAVVQLDPDDDGVVSVKAGEKDEMRCLFMASEPINEPVVRHGPFVMNTREEIEETIKAYSEGRLAPVIKGAEERHRQTKAALATQQKNKKE